MNDKMANPAPPTPAPQDQAQTPEEAFLYQRGYRGLGEARVQAFKRGHIIDSQEQRPFRPQRGSR